MREFVDIEMVRDHLGDQMGQRNLKASQDLTWSDEDLKKALEGAARSYNSLPPFVNSYTDETRLPARTDMFLDAAAAVAMERKVRQLVQDRQVFEAGGVQTDPDGAVIDGLSKLAAELRQKFMTEASAYKAEFNWRACWGRVG
jgi:hypothetical protein